MPELVILDCDGVLVDTERIGVGIDVKVLASDLFLHAARERGVSPKDCVVVEDSANGVRAARAANMAVLGYAGGLTPADTLAHLGARTFVDMRLLPDLLAEMSR